MPINSTNFFRWQQEDDKETWHQKSCDQQDVNKPSGSKKNEARQAKKSFTPELNLVVIEQWKCNVVIFAYVQSTFQCLHLYENYNKGTLQRKNMIVSLIIYSQYILSLPKLWITAEVLLLCYWKVIGKTVIYPNIYNPNNTLQVFDTNTLCHMASIQVVVWFLPHPGQHIWCIGLSSCSNPVL